MRLCAFGSQRFYSPLSSHFQRSWFEEFKTLFFVKLTVLEDETTALYRDVGNQIPGEAQRRFIELTYHSHCYEYLRIRVQWGLFTVWGMCNIQKWLELRDRKEQVLLVLLDDEGRTSFWRAVGTSAKCASDNGECPAKIISFRNTSIRFVGII